MEPPAVIDSGSVVDIGANIDGSVPGPGGGGGPTFRGINFRRISR